MAVALLGPTASGKSAAALAVARRAPAVDRARRAPAVDRARRSPAGGVPVELVSVDSMAVYRGMDIGTAKPTPAQQAEVPVHLIDLADPDEEFTVTRFQAAARSALAEIAARGHAALLVGGTGLYLRSVVDDLRFPGRFPDVAAGLTAELDAVGPTGSPARRLAVAELHARLTGCDPVAAGRIEPGNERRVVRALEVTLGSGQPFSTFGPGLERYPPSPVRMVGLVPPPEVDGSPGPDRVEARFRDMLDAGLLDEVRALAARPGGLSRTARQALGYRELLAHVEEGVPLEDAVDEAVRRTRLFARRQLAWFRRDPRIRWVADGEDPVEVVEAALDADRSLSVRDWEERP